MIERRASRAPLRHGGVLALLVAGCTGGSLPSGALPPDNPTPATQNDRSEIGAQTTLPVGTLAAGETPSPIPVESDDPTWGAQDAPVTLVEFVDFQCPYCAAAHSTVQQLKLEYGSKKLRVVVKHSPLDFHRDAVPAALASQAVFQLLGSDAFFGYAEQLFAGQRALSEANLVQWASQVGAPRELFLETLGSRSLLESVAHDRRLGERLGVEGTPAFRINGKRLDGAQSIDEFRAIIDAELVAADALMRAGTPQREIYAARTVHNAGQELVAHTDAQPVYRVPVDGSPVLGPPGAPVTIVQFSEFQCADCKQAQATLKRLRARYPDQVRVVFKHLPMPLHERALSAARLSSVLHERRGNAAFWEAVDKLFTASPNLGDEVLMAIGTALGLSRQEVQAAIDGKEYSQRVGHDMNLAEDVQVRGSPTFFINGRRLSGARPLAHFEAVVQRELTRAKTMLQAGVEPNALYAHIIENGKTAPPPKRYELPSPTDDQPTRGPAEAPVVIHVFSDFECGFCARASTTLEQVEQAYRGKTRIVWHNLPLSFHQHARAAAVAGLIAFDQKGRAGFWKLHDMMYASHGAAGGPALERAHLIEYATQAGLDARRFTTALDSHAYDARLKLDEKLAGDLQVRGTPAFFINGYALAGAQPLRRFRALIDRILDEQKSDTQKAKPSH